MHRLPVLAESLPRVCSTHSQSSLDPPATLLRHLRGEKSRPEFRSLKKLLLRKCEPACNMVPFVVNLILDQIQLPRRLLQFYRKLNVQAQTASCGQEPAYLRRLRQHP